MVIVISSRLSIVFFAFAIVTFFLSIVSPSFVFSIQAGQVNEDELLARMAREDGLQQTPVPPPPVKNFFDHVHDSGNNTIQKHNGSEQSQKEQEKNQTSGSHHHDLQDHDQKESEGETIPTTATSTPAENGNEQIMMGTTTTTTDVAPITTDKGKKGIKTDHNKTKKGVQKETENEVKEKIQPEVAEEEIPIIRTKDDLIEAVVLQRIRDTKLAALKERVSKIRLFENFKCSSSSTNKNADASAAAGSGSVSADDEEDPVCAIKRVS